MWHAHLARDSRAGRPCHFALSRIFLRYTARNLKKEAAIEDTDLCKSDFGSTSVNTYGHQ